MYPVHIGVISEPKTESFHVRELQRHRNVQRVTETRTSTNYMPERRVLTEKLNSTKHRVHYSITQRCYTIEYKMGG
jgi:hypothetical protein